MSRQIEQLVKMANQIALNVAAGQDEVIVARETAAHIRKFWTPAMRQQLLDFRRAGGAVAPAVAIALAALDNTDSNRSDTQ